MLDPNKTITQQIEEGTLHPALVAAYQAGLKGDANYLVGSIDCDEMASFHEGSKDLRKRKLLNSHLEIAINVLELLNVEGKLILEEPLKLGDSALLDRLAELACNVRSHALGGIRAQS